jgi:hypothetical protein
VQSWLTKRIKRNSDGGVESDSETFENSFRPLRLGRCNGIEEIVSDNVVVIETHRPRAALSNDVILIVGNPSEFATALGKILIEAWGLSDKRNLVTEFIEIGQALSRLDALTFQLGSDEDVKSTESIVPVETERHSKESGPKTAEHPPPVTVPESENTESEPDRQTSSHAHPEADPDSETINENSGGTYSSEDREALMDSYVRKHQEIEQKIANLKAVGLGEPHEAETNEGSKNGLSSEFRSDEVYRAEVCKYERQRGRWPIEKGSTQGGHDIDSFTHPPGDPQRRLIRRIEVKGRSAKWEGNETVEMSARQFRDALSKEVEGDSEHSEGFDYWLYVVEWVSDENYKVLPIRNPALAAKKFEVRAGTWRTSAETDDEDTD